MVDEECDPQGVRGRVHDFYLQRIASIERPVLAQPNNQIHLYLAADRARRDKVFNQLIRPSFQELAPRCEFLGFDVIEKAMAHVDSLNLGTEGRVSGLLQGERFAVPEHSVYPSGI